MARKRKPDRSVSKPLTQGVLWTRAEAAARLTRAGLRISERTLMRMEKDGNKPEGFPEPTRIRGRVFYLVTKVELYCQSLEGASNGA